jgi:hypothetical protein
MSVFQKKAKSGGACGCRGIKHKHTIVFPECLSQPVYTQKNVTAEDNSGIKVVMFEGNTKITSGLLSKVKVKTWHTRGFY